MAVTISRYNHTLKRYIDGSNAVGDTYKINLYSTLSFDATATTKAAAESGATQLSTANGYTQNAKTLSNLVVTIAGTNGVKLDADDVTWTASGGAITASKALIYNDTDTDDPPLFYIDFDGSQSAGDGTDFKVVLNANGLLYQAGD